MEDTEVRLSCLSMALKLSENPRNNHHSYDTITDIARHFYTFAADIPPLQSSADNYYGHPVSAIGRNGVPQEVINRRRQDIGVVATPDVYHLDDNGIQIVNYPTAEAAPTTGSTLR